MKDRIFIFGASGSGTSTLGKSLAEKLNYCHFDTDDYFWMPPKYSFTHKRETKERQQLLMSDLTKEPQWVLSGSLCGWGDIFMPLFEVAIYVYLQKDIRIERLIKREKERYREEIEPGGKKYDDFVEFIRWASEYDEGGLDMRSKSTHKEWMKGLNCPIIRIDGDLTLDERLNLVLEKLDIDQLTNSNL